MKEFKIISHATNNQQPNYHYSAFAFTRPTRLFSSSFSSFPDILNLQIVTHDWLLLNQIHLQQHLNVFIASHVVHVIIISCRGFRHCWFSLWNCNCLEKKKKSDRVVIFPKAKEKRTQTPNLLFCRIVCSCSYIQSLTGIHIFVSLVLSFLLLKSLLNFISEREKKQKNKQKTKFWHFRNCFVELTPLIGTFSFSSSISTIW